MRQGTGDMGPHRDIILGILDKGFPLPPSEQLRLLGQLPGSVINLVVKHTGHPSSQAGPESYIWSVSSP